MLKDLFIVRSPLQLLNAIEAREAFSSRHNMLIMMFNDNEMNSSQMRRLLVPGDWDEIIECNFSLFAKWKRLIAQFSFIKKIKKNNYNRLFSGDFGTINQVIIANANSKEIYLIDDGTATIRISKDLQDRNWFAAQSFSRRSKFYRYKLAGLNYKTEQSIHFFTIYNLQASHGEKIIQHRFPYLKANKLHSCKKCNTTYVLGQNLIEIGAMKEDVYIGYLEKIIANYKKKIVYIPHRSEEITPALLALKSDKFIIENSVGAIETVLLDKGVYPEHIVSFISSALFNLNKIFSDAAVDAIKINPADLKTHQDIIHQCYQFFEETDVNIINLN